MEVGDRVRLKGTNREYKVLSIYSVKQGKDSKEEPIIEQWADLQYQDRIAKWKLGQLEQCDFIE